MNEKAGPFEKRPEATAEQKKAFDNLVRDLTAFVVKEGIPLRVISHKELFGGRPDAWAHIGSKAESVIDARGCAISVTDNETYRPGWLHVYDEGGMQKTGQVATMTLMPDLMGGSPQDNWNFYGDWNIELEKWELLEEPDEEGRVDTFTHDHWLNIEEMNSLSVLIETIQAGRPS